MVETNESLFPPSLNLDKVTISFDKLINTDLFLQTWGLYVTEGFELQVRGGLVVALKY